MPVSEQPRLIEHPMPNSPWPERSLSPTRTKLPPRRS